MKRFGWKALLCSFVCMLAGCASPVMKPDMVDRLSGLVSPDMLKPGVNSVSESKTTTVALVLSENVPKSLKITDSMLSLLTGPAQLYHLDFKSGDDAKIVLSGDRLIQALRAPLKQRFREVLDAKTVREGFEKGADYVVILDLELGYEYHEDSTYKWMNFTHTANSSYLFINRNLEQGPDIVANVEHQQKTPAAGASANNSDFLVNVREARVKMLKKVHEEFSIKVRN